MQLPRTLLFKEWATEKESGNEKEKDQSKRKEDIGKTNVLKSIKGERRGREDGKPLSMVSWGASSDGFSM